MPERKLRVVRADPPENADDVVLAELAKSLDEKLEDALQAAAEEARQQGRPMAAHAATELRDYLMQWREVALQRIKELGVVALPQDQQEQLMMLLAREMVAKILAEKKEKQTREEAAEIRKTSEFWSTRQAKFAIVMGGIGLFVTMLAQVYNAFFGVAHPIRP